MLYELHSTTTPGERAHISHEYARVGLESRGVERYRIPIAKKMTVAGDEDDG